MSYKGKIVNHIDGKGQIDYFVPSRGTNRTIFTKAAADIPLHEEIEFDFVDGNVVIKLKTIKDEPTPESVAAFTAEVEPAAPKEGKKPETEDTKDDDEEVKTSVLNHHGKDLYEANKAADIAAKEEAKARKAAKKADKEARDAESRASGSKGPRHCGSVRNRREEDRANYED